MGEELEYPGVGKGSVREEGHTDGKLPFHPGSQHPGSALAVQTGHLFHLDAAHPCLAGQVRKIKLLIWQGVQITALGAGQKRV